MVLVELSTPTDLGAYTIHPGPPAHLKCFTLQILEREPWRKWAVRRACGRQSDGSLFPRLRQSRSDPALLPRQFFAMLVQNFGQVDGGLRRPGRRERAEQGIVIFLADGVELV